MASHTREPHALYLLNMYTILKSFNGVLFRLFYVTHKTVGHGVFSSFQECQVLVKFTLKIGNVKKTVFSPSHYHVINGSKIFKYKAYPPDLKYRNRFQDLNAFQSF
jgi:hypothetical protein